MVLLACHGINVSINFLSLFTCLLIHIKASNIGCKLCLDYSNSYLLPDGNANLGGAGLDACLLYTLCQPVVSPHFAILPPEVREDNSMQGGLAKKDLA